MIEGLGILLEFLASWRMYSVWILTGLLIYALATRLPNDTLAWLIGAPIGVFGFATGMWWEYKAMRSRIR